MWRIRIWSRNNERVTARRRCMIKDGYMKKGANVRVMQGDAIMYDGKLKVGVGCAGFGGGVAVVSSLEVICSTVVVVPSGRTRDNPHTAVAVSRRARRRERDNDDDDDRSRAAHTSGRFGRRDCETRTCGATAVPACGFDASRSSAPPRSIPSVTRCPVRFAARAPWLSPAAAVCVCVSACVCSRDLHSTPRRCATSKRTSLSSTRATSAACRSSTGRR